MTGTGGWRPQASHRIGGTGQPGARTGIGPREAQVTIGGARTHSTDVITAIRARICR